MYSILSAMTMLFVCVCVFLFIYYFDSIRLKLYDNGPLPIPQKAKHTSCQRIICKLRSINWLSLYGYQVFLCAVLLSSINFISLFCFKPSPLFTLGVKLLRIPNFKIGSSLFFSWCFFFNFNEPQNHFHPAVASIILIMVWTNCWFNFISNLFARCFFYYYFGSCI